MFYVILKQITCFRVFGSLIPFYLKNILNLAGYSNFMALESFSSNDIDFIEKFVIQELPDILKNKENVNLADYYFIYSKNTEDFKIVLGHSKILYNISKQIEDKGLEFFSKKFKEFMINLEPASK